jgi:hypothetical protein
VNMSWLMWSPWLTDCGTITSDHPPVYAIRLIFRPCDKRHKVQGIPSVSGVLTQGVEQMACS